jgi:hypothetical protein
LEFIQNSIAFVKRVICPLNNLTVWFMLNKEIASKFAEESRNLNDRPSFLSEEPNLFRNHQHEASINRGGLDFEVVDAVDTLAEVHFEL